MNAPTYKSNMQTLRLAVLGALSAAAPLLILAQDHSAHAPAAPPKLVQRVREATLQYTNVQSALDAGYQPFLGCVSGPDHGAMGVHYVNFPLVGDGQIDVARPEALIYEPFNGDMQLVGVEYIVDSATWLKTHDGPPVLEGQSFQLVGSPNRYGIPAPFFELHVWAWRGNPDGSFVDWNKNVTCEGQ